MFDLGKVYSFSSVDTRCPHGQREGEKWEKLFMNAPVAFNPLSLCFEHQGLFVSFLQAFVRTQTHTYPQVSVCQVWVVMSRVGAVDGLFAVNLNYAAVLNVPWVLQLIEDITGLIFNQQSRAGRPEYQ